MGRGSGPGDAIVFCIGLTFCWCLISICIAIPGIIFLFKASTDDRGQHISASLDALRSWETDDVNGYHPFEQQQYDARVLLFCEDSVVFNQTFGLQLQTSWPSDIYYEEARILSNHTVRVFSGSIPMPRYEVAGACDVITQIYARVSGEVVAYSGSQYLQYVAFGANHINGRQCPKKIGCEEGGYMDVGVCAENCDAVDGDFTCEHGGNHQCEVTSYITGACFKLSAFKSKDESTLYYTQDEEYPYSGVGCSLPFTAVVTPSVEMLSSSPRPEFTVVVRSAYDPYLVYVAESGFTDGFGATVDEKMDEGVTFVVVGLAMMLLPCLCGSCLLLSWGWQEIAARRQERERRSYQPFPSTSTSTTPQATHSAQEATPTSLEAALRLPISTPFPPEPDPGPGTMSLTFQTPDGTSFVRRFISSDTVDMLYMFLHRVHRIDPNTVVVTQHSNEQELMDYSQSLYEAGLRDGDILDIEY